MPAVVVNSSVLINCTVGVLLRAKLEGKIAALRPILDLLQQRTTFWLSAQMYQAVLRKAGE